MHYQWQSAQKPVYMQAACSRAAEDPSPAHLLTLASSFGPQVTLGNAAFACVYQDACFSLGVKKHRAAHGRLCDRHRHANPPRTAAARCAALVASWELRASGWPHQLLQRGICWSQEHTCSRCTCARNKRHSLTQLGCWSQVNTKETNVLMCECSFPPGRSPCTAAVRGRLER
jgi:hypothetical protein